MSKNTKNPEQGKLDNDIKRSYKIFRNGFYRSSFLLTLKKRQMFDGAAYATADAIVVEEEDTLWDLAGKAYGDPAKWQLIYEANRGQLASPDLIYPGMKLEIPR